MNEKPVHPYLAVVLFCITSAAIADDSEALNAIGATIDRFHAAAARGDKGTYLDTLTEDGVFLGTDEWERWPKVPEFTDYVSGRFADGGGWTYRAVERNVALSDDGNTAWFDEVIVSSSDARFRGTGVLVKTDDRWKIAHYAMSFLVLNEIWEEVIRLNQQTRQQKATGDDGSGC